MRLQCIQCDFETTDLTMITCPHHSPYYSYLDVVGAPRWIPLLGEGNTPLRALKQYSTPAHRVFAKCETANPTGSIKDREVAAIFRFVRDTNIPHVIIVSSGNGAKSASWYAKQLGIECICHVSNSINADKEAFFKRYGIRVIKHSGDYETTYRAAIDNKEHYNITPGINPFATLGTQVIASELIKELDHVDTVIVPVGNGTQLAGIWEGFLETKQRPRMVGVQMQGAAPLLEAFRQKKSYVALETAPSSLAHAIAARESFSSPKALRALDESGGTVVTVSEEQLRETWDRWKQDTEIAPEPSSVAVFAALEHDLIEGLGGNTVVIVSGRRMD